jgi:predicted HTH transcriptional regulator
MKFTEILKQPENRRLEFKESLPSKSDLAKTIVAFSNDAGGELYIGIKDKPREIVGVKEDDLLLLEEKISNIIHDQCSPFIRPDILFINYEEKHIIKIVIHKGNNPPYYISNKGIENGTYLRIGSTNRQIDKEIIAELERQKNDISYDSEICYQATVSELDLTAFKKLYEEKAKEKLTDNVLKKLKLVVSEQGNNLPTNALVLLSGDDIRSKVFPYAKIECARFKGIIPGNFIDQKSIDVNIGLQSEQAYQFVLRHISEGTVDYEGVYRKDRWEYPVIAIREVIRNAVIHRDYSFKGKDIKIAIFDDKIEITSPGTLMHSVNFDDMEAGQSEIRNRILAPVFKKMGVIEQWGNGLQLIANELKNYPEIEFKWSEPGIAFRVSFIKSNYTELSEKDAGESSGEVREKVREKFGKNSEKIIKYMIEKPEITIPELSEKIGISTRSIEKTISRLKKDGILERVGSTKSGYWKIIINSDL